ncbi:MAG: alanine racemase [Treponema sp.]|jgi:alanine racemase|nr:alanine racemase [Treponema sp.]
MRATRALIHLDRFRRNIETVRGSVGSRLICVPVKAGAYGHGALPMAGAALEAGAGYLAVATAGEGTELREGGVTAPILLLSVPLIEEIPQLVSGRLIPLAADREFAAALAAAAEREGIRLPVHLKVDTGMGRIGCRPEEAAELGRYIQSLKSLEYAGTATHLAVSDSTAGEDIRYTRQQLARFREAVESLKQAGVDPGVVHAANTGGVVFHEESWFDMVRPGILLYGYAPAESALQTEPVMELVSRITFIKKVRKGESVSYGRTWTAPGDRIIATIPLGYGDGFPRALSGNHQVYIRGRPYPLAGRICMDQCMIDLGTGTDIGRWEEVTVFGGTAPGAGHVAGRLGTIPYEITCNINKRVPRVYV